MDSFYFATHTRGQDILHIFSSKQTVGQPLIDVLGPEILQEIFHFMGKITIGNEPHRIASFHELRHEYHLLENMREKACSRRASTLATLVVKASGS